MSLSVAVVMAVLFVFRGIKKQVLSTENADSFLSIEVRRYPYEYNYGLHSFVKAAAGSPRQLQRTLTPSTTGLKVIFT